MTPVLRGSSESAEEPRQSSSIVPVPWGSSLARAARDVYVKKSHVGGVSQGRRACRGCPYATGAHFQPERTIVLARIRRQYLC